MNGRVDVFLGAGSAGLRQIALSWLVDSASSAVRAVRPWAVLAPSRSYAHALKQMASARGLSLAGVRFLTPGDARRELGRILLGERLRLVPRSNLALLMASILEEKGAPIREPARLLHALDQLTASGWGVDRIGFEPVEKAARAFEVALQELGWASVSGYDRAVAAAEPVEFFDRLLVVGFDAAHWELFHLLNAAVRCATRATVLLAAPRSRAEWLDQVWIGSWEDAFGEAESIETVEASAPFAALAQRMENPFHSNQSKGPPPFFLVGQTIRDQAEAAVHMAVRFAADPESDRIGILVPGPGPLAHEISRVLRRLGVPHFDPFGRPAQPDGSTSRWLSWTAFQRQPTFSRFLHATRCDAGGFLNISEQRAAFLAQGEAMSSDLAILRALLETSGDLVAARLAARMAPFRALTGPKRIASFAEETRAAWQELGWQDIIPALDHAVRSLGPIVERTVPLAAWLDWLDAVAPRPAPFRDELASNPFARIHLATYAQAEGLPWSHLILTGLNQGEWPPSSDNAGLIDDRCISKMNQEALQQGAQGQGHLSVKAGHALILGDADRREVLRRQFYNLVETPTRGLALLCSLDRGDGSGRPASPSDFLSHAYHCACDAPLDETAMRWLAERTTEWLADSYKPAALPPSVQPAPTDRVERARRARLSRERFGPFECAFSGDPPKPALLSCQEWESAIRNPMSAWFKCYLKVEPPPDFRREDPWPLMRGIWVHRFLNKAMGDTNAAWVEVPTLATLVERLGRACEEVRNRIENAYKQAGRGPPDWWHVRLAQARWTARSMIEQIASVKDWPLAASEWSLSREIPIPVGASTALRIRGRIDLLFARQLGPDEIPRECWVVDFKTGTRKRALRRNRYLRDLANGDGIQVGLYALALAELGAERISASIWEVNAIPEEQVTLDEIRSASAFWSGLARMQETGVFGIRGDVRAEFGTSVRAPLATLRLNPALLEDKWALTHPNLTGAEGESDHAT